VRRRIGLESGGAILFGMACPLIMAGIHRHPYRDTVVKRILPTMAVGSRRDRFGV